MTMLRSAQQQQQQLRTLLKETIVLLCRNGLIFDAELNIEALVGITIDHNEVILVSLRETIESEQKKNATGDARYYKVDSDIDSVKSSNCPLRHSPGSKRPSTTNLPPPVKISPPKTNISTAVTSLLSTSPSCPSTVAMGSATVGSAAISSAAVGSAAIGFAAVGSALPIASSFPRQRKRQCRNSGGRGSLEYSQAICSDFQQQQPTSSIESLQAMVQSQQSPPHNPPPVRSSFLISNICGKDAEERTPLIPQPSPKSRHSSVSDNQMEAKAESENWSVAMTQIQGNKALPADSYVPASMAADAENSDPFHATEDSVDLMFIKEEPATGSLDFEDADISVDGENAFDSTDRSDELRSYEAATSGNMFGASQSDVDMDLICRTILAYDGWCVPLRDIQRLRLHSIPSAVVRSAMEVLDRGDLGRFRELGSNLGVFYKCPPHLIDQKTLASYAIPFHTYASWYSSIPAPNATNRHNERYWCKVVQGSPYTS